jgi:uncharacterized protein YbjT (DUF2867 family)/uncharacterized membrane protein YphA (DoxX/SURF4 family)
VKVLIAGASGFIGARLARAFAARGHAVVAASRGGSTGARHVTLDYAAPPDVDALARELAGIDVVVNAVGILRERGTQTFEALHVRGPHALFAACVAAGVPRAIQISALGAEPDAKARYHRSKYAADARLLELPLDSAIVRPSLVYGPGGTSATMFDRLAALPLIPLPAGGGQRVQPVHIDDLVDAVVRLAESPIALNVTLPVVGPEPLTLRDFLARLRHAFGWGRARFLAIPRTLVALAARLGDLVPRVLLDSETLGMLERGNVADAAPLEKLLGRKPRAVADFIAPPERDSRRAAAALGWLLPLLRVSVAVMWLFAGIVSLGPYPVAESLALLTRIGVPAALAPLLLYGASAVDIAFGILILLPRRPAWLWSAQIAIVLVYTAILTWRLPALWLEPFGPVAKNLPILALLLLLKQLEARR